MVIKSLSKNLIFWKISSKAYQKNRIENIPILFQTHQLVIKTQNYISYQDANQDNTNYTHTLNYSN